MTWSYISAQVAATPNLMMADVTASSKRLAEPTGASKFGEPKPTKNSRTVVVVDDSESVRRMLCVLLTQNNFNALTAADGVELESILQSKSVDLILLDVELPGESGFQICERLCRNYAHPIIFLSAHDDEAAKVRGLMLGAEDYIVKPFSPAELVARLNVALRRINRLPSATNCDEIEFYGWTLNNKTRNLTSPNGRTLTLSAAEYVLLNTFINNPGRVLSRNDIIARIGPSYGYKSGRSLDTLICRFRNKLKYAHPVSSRQEELIRTRYGVGYFFKSGLSGHEKSEALAALPTETKTKH